jgi:multidrug efflux pump subunit AcrB
MASAVAQPLETQFAQIPGVAQMTLDQRTRHDRDHHPIRSRPQHRCGRKRRAGGDSTRRADSCPKNLPTPPDLPQGQPADSPILLLGARSDYAAADHVDDYVENKLAAQISQIAGVAQVSIGGQQKPAIRIQLDPANSWPRDCRSRMSASRSR